MSTSLTEFLLARIEEDEMAARAASQFPYEGLSWADHVLSSERDTTPAMDAFVERHDPARVLAECAAKRRIVAMHGSEVQDLCGGDPFPCETLRALASVYAGHPEFDPQWSRPEGVGTT